VTKRSSGATQARRPASRPRPRRAAGTAGARSRSRLGEQAHADLEALLAPAQRTSAFAWSKPAAGALLVGSIYLIFVFLTSPRFRVRELIVSGTELQSPQAVERVAALQGESTFLVRDKPIAERLLRELPMLRRVHVTTRLPNRVFIDVQENQALLAWESGGQFWWVDDHGETMGSSPDHGGLTRIRDVAGIGTDARSLLRVPWGLARDVADELPQIEAMDYTRESGLIVHVTEDRWPVYLGHEGDAHEKIVILHALVAKLMKDDAIPEYIDLRDENMPTLLVRGDSRT